MPPIEAEAAFVICAPDAGAVADAVAGLPALGGLTLRPGAPRHMRDVHFDTPDRRLGARGFVLRIRRLASGDLLTLKGASRMTDWGGTERLEIEGPWSAATFDDIARALAQAGATLPMQPVNFEAADHEAVLMAAGLQLIQDRETERAIRDVVDHGGSIVAELAIDRVTVRSAAQPARFSQIEIESKSAAGSAMLSRIVRDLRTRFGDTLRPWPYGKLATGLALADAIADGHAGNVCGPDGALTETGCDVLEAALRRRRATPSGSVP